MFMGGSRALGGYALVSTTTLDPANTAPTVTLSNGNLTGTANSNAVDGAVSRSNTSHSTGKYFASILVVTDTSNSASLIVGLINASQPVTEFLGETANSLGYLDSNGRIFRDGLNVTTLHPFVAGDVVDSATDLDNNKQWVRVNGGGWNNDILANQNPATNTGGIDISAGAGGPTGPLFFGIEVEHSGDSITVNFGATAYTFAAPAGFGNW